MEKVKYSFYTFLLLFIAFSCISTFYAMIGCKLAYII